jgi:hypothetical protein
MSELDKHLNENAKRLKSLFKKVSSDLQDQIDDADITDVGVIVRSVWDDNDVKGEFHDVLVNGAVKATEVGYGTKEGSIAFRGYYDDMYSMKGTKLSESIQDVTRTDEIESMIKKAMKTEQTIQKLSVDLVDKEITKAELPKYIENFLSAFRNAASLTDDTEAYAKYRKAVSRLDKQIETLTDQDTSRLARAYKDISELSLDASSEVVDKTIERAVMFKARSNALRLAQTETAAAYGNARVETALSDDDAIGIKVSLSGEHEDYCICDFFAESDMFGLGEGVFPKDELPEYPFHPHCACLLDSVYRGDADAEYDDDAAQKAFDDLEDDERAALVGKKGDWEDLDWKDHKLPKDYEEVGND